jgi:hypothetical protein
MEPEKIVDNIARKTECARVPTWDELRIVVMNGWAVERLMDRTEPKFRYAMALALNVAKWSPKRGEYRGYGEDGLCRHFNLVSRGQDRCDICTWAKRHGRCLSTGSMIMEQVKEFCEWKEANPNWKEMERPRGWLDRIYDATLRMYREEYER